MSSLPIILYIGWANCGACTNFEARHLDNLCEKARGKYRMIKFKKMKNEDQFDYCLKDKISWFPTFILVSPWEYARFYDSDGNPSPHTSTDLMDCEVYNRVTVDGKHTQAGRSGTPDDIIAWASVMVPNMKI